MTLGKVPLFEIFVGGPMIAANDPRYETELDEAGDPIGAHFSALTSAVRKIAGRLNDELEGRINIRILEPPMLGAGHIPKEVFERIDEADFGIFDVSGSTYDRTLPDGSTIPHSERASPNVIYELGLMHALGLPTMCVALPSAPHIFYIGQCYAATVERFKTETLAEQLYDPIKRVIDSALDPSVPFFGADIVPEDESDVIRDPAANPITNFYRLPIVDVASSSGLATGYYVNFIRNVLEHRRALTEEIKENDDSVRSERFAAQKLVLLEPTWVEDTYSLRDEMDELLKLPEIQERYGARKSVKLEFVDERDFSRTQFLSAIGDYLYDIPTALYALVRSERYKRVAAWHAAMPSGGDRRLDGLIEKRQDEMKRAFFHTILRHINDRPGPVRREFVERMTVAEFRAFLLSGDAE